MKKEINRTLGNSLRCILPSYWWKKLLGKMADRIESAESSASSAMTMATLAGREASDKQPQLVSGSNIKTINGQSILGSGNITVSTERMEKYKTKEELDAVGSTDGGEIAAVVDDVLVEKSFAECYQPTSAEINANKYNVKFTKVDGLVLNPDFNPNLISSNYGSLIVVLYSDGKSKGYHKGYPSHMEIVCDYNRQINCYEYDGYTGSGHRLYDSSGFHASAIDIVNNILREGNFRFSYFEVTYRNDVNATSYTYYYSYNANFPSDATAMIDNVVKMLFAETQNADIYVRSKEWEKLSKESIVTSTDELNNLVLPKGSIAQVTVGGLTKVKASELFLSLETAVNWDKYTIIKNIKKTGASGTNQTGQLMLTNGEISLYVTCSSVACYGLYTKDEVETQIDLDEINQMLSEKDFRCVYVHFLDVVDSYLELYTQTPVVSDAYIKGETWTRLLKEGDVTGGANVIIDSELSGTSENPVQNKVIKAYVDEKVANAGGGSSVDVDTELSNTSTNPVQNKVITNAINAKADNTRVDLISERLDDIDSEMKDFATESQLNNKQDVITDLDTIRQGAAKGATAIQSIPSEYVTETKLSQKGYATTSQLNNKQDIISDLATIRSNASKGATALQSVPSEYVTETELSSKNFATVSQVNAKQDTISDLATIRSNAAKGATAIQQVKTINGEAIVGEGNIDVLTKDLYDNILEEMLVNEEVYAAGVNDLNSRLLETNDALNSEVASREELSEEVQALTDRVTSNEEVTATSYNELNSRIESNYQHSEEAYATKTELADEVSTINAAIVDNEEVIAATLNDLLSRIESLTTRIEQLENA